VTLHDTQSFVSSILSPECSQGQAIIVRWALCVVCVHMLLTGLMFTDVKKSYPPSYPLPSICLLLQADTLDNVLTAFSSAIWMLLEKELNLCLMETQLNQLVQQIWTLLIHIQQAMLSQISYPRLS